jgi:DNA sulfur modification protein DndD
MKIKVLGWRSKGMRCPDAKLAFDKANNVDVIQMNNGTGKTTTLKLIQIALSGPNIEYSDDEDVKLKTKPDEYLHMDAGKGSFELDMEFDDDSYTFIVEINKGSEDIKFSTSSPKIGGKLSGYHPPEEAAPFLSIDFVKLIVFDGEKAGELFGEGQSARNSINTLCQFNILDNSKNIAYEFLQIRLKEDGSGKGAKATETKVINEYESFSARLKKVEKIRNDLVKETENKKSKFKKLDTKVGSVKASEEKFKREFKEITDDKSNLKQEISDLQVSILGELQNPMQADSSIKNQLIEFTEHLEKLRLPDSVAGPFFRELSEASECICGREIGKVEQKCILDNEDKYLDDSTQGTLNTIKDEIISAKNYDDNLSALIDKLTKADKKSQVLITKEKQIDKKIADVNSGFRDDLELLGTLKKEIEDSMESIESIDAPYDASLLKNPIDDIWNIATLKKHIIELEKEVGRKKDAAKLLSSKKVFDEIIDETIANSSKSIHDGILKASQELLDKVLASAEPPVEIEGIDGYIKLKNRTGLSEGQKLSAAYVFIMSATKYAKVEVPLIVDSPVGKISGAIRREVGAAIPKLTSQFFTFITDTEKPYFLEELHKNADKKGSYTTIFWLNDNVQNWLNANLEEAEIKKVIKDGKHGVMNGYDNMMRYDIAAKDESVS